jgi:hypothetical protein
VRAGAGWPSGAISMRRRALGFHAPTSRCYGSWRSRRAGFLWWTWCCAARRRPAGGPHGRERVPPPPRGRERRRYSNTQPLKQHAIAELDHDPTGSKWARRCDIPKAVPQLLSPRTCALVSAKTAWSLALRKHQRGPAIWHARAVMDRLSSFFSLGVVGRDGGTRTVSTAAALPGASNS